MGKKNTPEIDPDFFEIDPNRLDEEWVAQPKLFMKYSMMLADARRQLDIAKSKLEVVKAEVDRDIRRNPIKYGLDGRVTEKSIEALVPLQKKFRKGLAEVHNAKHSVDILYAAVTTLDHRKKGLEKLVDLHGQQYFSAPRASGENKEAMEEVERKAKMSGRKTRPK